MKQKTLLLFLATLTAVTGFTQKNKKITAYAITGAQKGSNNWTEVRLVDLQTGEEVQSVYQSSQSIEVFNARTGKQIAQPSSQTIRQEQAPEVIRKEVNGSIITIIRQRIEVRADQFNKPFSSSSAACALDSKHERLYYVPMGINELRYIDLKSKTPKAYFFEGEIFGVQKSRNDVANQITRMVIASDGNGYALTNNGEHLIQFTTGKKPTITDLGAITDTDAQGKFSIHNSAGYGGDLIADAQKNLYLITANRNVYKIALESKLSTYLGTISGLPRGFTTNGAIAEGGSNVIVGSSNSTEGYYRFDLNDLKAEKISTQTSVFNASDLASGTLLFEKKKRERKEEPAQQEQKPVTPVTTLVPSIKAVDPLRGSFSVFPNPVSTETLKLSFNDLAEGRYQVQLIDISGKTINAQQININSKVQRVEYRLPDHIANGNYIVKVINQSTLEALSSKIVVQGR